jgi:uncharacterized caspase-like protein
MKEPRRPLHAWAGLALAAAALGGIACSDGGSGSDSRGVRVVAADTAASVDAAQKGRAFAVAIGIDEYEKAPRLRYAAADAISVAEALRAQGFEVTTLLNRQATRGAILGELGDRLAARVGPDDRVVVFFAGHGQDRKKEGGGRSGYLLPVEGDVRALAETAIPMGQIRDLSHELAARHVLFLVDACYGGIAGVASRAAGDEVDADYLRMITRERGRQLITAGGADQEAGESPEYGHSFFTHYLLQGLTRGLADLDGNGIVPSSELYQYLERRVFAAAREQGHEQHPELWDLAADKGQFVFLTKAQAAAGPAVADDEAAKPGPEASPADEAEVDAALAALRARVEDLSAQQEAGGRTLDEMHAAAQDAIRQIRAGDGGDPPAAPAPQPVLPPRTWSCDAGAVVVNGEVVPPLEIARLVATLGGTAPPPGCYWYDAQSGMWGREGEPPAGDMVPGLAFGGRLRADASNGNTGVFLNGREITPLEQQRLAGFGVPLPPGRYWMNAQGVGGVEGGPAQFSVAAAAQAAGAVQAGAGTGGSGASGDTYYQSGDAYGGVQGDCVYLSGSDFSYLGEGCD